jgi:hypothetical protein
MDDLGDPPAIGEPPAGVDKLEAGILIPSDPYVLKECLI